MNFKGLFISNHKAFDFRWKNTNADHIFLQKFVERHPIPCSQGLEINIDISIERCIPSLDYTPLDYFGDINHE